MKRFILLTGLALTVTSLGLAGTGLAEEGGNHEQEMCAKCAPGGMMGERLMKEHEMMRSMMERMMGRGEPHGRMSLSFPEIKEELKLTKEQIEALKPIEIEYRKVTIKKTADIRVAEIELAALLDQKKPDQAGLKKKVSEMGALQTELMMYRIEALLKLREVLNEEQHERFKALLRQRMEHFGERGPMHGQGGMMGEGVR